MPNEIVLRSAALDDTVKSVSTFNAARRRLGRSSLKEMGGMSFSSSETTDGYRGYFKLEALSMTLLQICNGWQPDSEFCGRSDVPGLDNIPRMELEIPEALTAQLLDIHLVFFYDRASKVYSVKLMYDLPEEMVFSRYIGSFRYGRVTQQYKAEGESDRMIFGDEWYLK